MEERAEQAAAHAKAEPERWLKNHHEEQCNCLADCGKRLAKEEAKFKEDVRKEIHEAERLMKRERSAQAKASAPPRSRNTTTTTQHHQNDSTN
jgi:hypothetical protein